jgi:hypothetical protein
LKPQPYGQLVVTISTIELGELQRQMPTYAPKDDTRAKDEPIHAAESVAIGMLAVLAGGSSPSGLPTCHTCAAVPGGWDPCSVECERCLDKLTCIVALHRVGCERPRIRIGDRLVQSVSAVDAAKQVPLSAVLQIRPVVESDIHSMSIAKLRARAKALGLKLDPKATRADLLAALTSALPLLRHLATVDETQAVVQPEPVQDVQILELRTGHELTCRIPGVDVKVKVSIRDGLPELVWRKKRFADVRDLTSEVMVDAKLKPKKLALTTAWKVWGVRC